ncbi:hypothetical protein GQ42DRAFT_163962 [Ramicandelaber brevisporus]|nr:hypothetical protein GQ42DRAFT_163962 [Ramicandelaber brevisporus]
MIKDSIPSSSRSEVDRYTARQRITAVVIYRLRSVRYDDAKNLKQDILCVQRFIDSPYTSTECFLAAKYGLVEAITRAIILLERFNELDEVEPILQKLHTYYRGPVDRFGNTPPSKVYLDMACDIYFTELDKEQKKNAADILYKKQRVCAMIEYADKLCKTSKRLSTAEAKNAFEGATNGIERVYPADSIVQLVTGVKGKLTLVVYPQDSTKPLYFEL